MAKWLKDYLNFGSRRDPPQPPRPDYSESEILRAYRVQKELDFEDPYQCFDKEHQNGGYSSCNATVNLPSFHSFGSVLPNGVEVKVVSPKHRLIKVDSQEFGCCKSPLSPVMVQEEPVVPSAPVVADTSTDYSDPFDARPNPRAIWESKSARTDCCSYMEPFEAQRVISELQHSVIAKRSESGDDGQLYDNPYEERARLHYQVTQPSQQQPQRVDCSLVQGDTRESRLPQDDERPADEYDQPWEWKRDNISKALAVQFEGAEWEHSRGPTEQSRLAMSGSMSTSADSTTLRLVGESPLVLGERVDPSVPLERQVWYHGALSRSDAENLLTLCKESSYLVRNSQTCQNDYSLSLRSCKGFMHMKFTQSSDGRYVLGENSPPFSTIPEVIHYYTTHKLPIRGAEHMSLLYPVIVQTL
ncbi:SH2 domain-containing adapter protein F-like [Thalassophryne amazonica]|uniref:SH2 domain-containing adapter protein F-like n=1 Tax=Thalassophryne amazonica TaxID=390379 RepID=UPI001471C981|nr:SH2 domain-containing adapter protein F-like [Thalassophryne amazonica]